MPRSTYRFLCSGIGATFAVLAIGTAVAPIVARAPNSQSARKPNPPVIFAQTKSDLAVDPAARFGRLPNGMTYVIYKNRTPPGTAIVWMRVAAGSAMEQEDQRGLAHFIEHMAFNGSKNIPQGEFVRLLQRDGLAFGADTNAQTQNFQTIYNLNLPDASQPIVVDALFLMRETAGNLTFDPGAIDRQRGVVLGEERARASVSSHANELQLQQMFPGTKFPERIPIGKVDVLKTAQRPTFLQFYNDFYRPEYTTLIVAGDVDPDVVEADIRRRFSDWHPAPQSPAGRTDYGTLIPRTKPEAHVHVAAGLTDTISIGWATPPVDVVETKAKDIDDLRFAIANAILSERLGRAAKGPDATFMSAGLDRENIARMARLVSIGIEPKDGQDRAAFLQVMAIVREYLANGPTQAELDRTLLRFDRMFTERAASARTIPTQALAAQILASLANQSVLQSPVQGLGEFKDLKPGFTLAAIRTALAQIKLADPPLIWWQGEHATPFDEAAMLAAYRDALAAPIGTYSAQGSVAWPYTQFGTPSAIVSRTTLAEVGATRVTFANGAVLTVKQTPYEQNSVHIVVQLGNGILGIRPDQAADLFMARQIGLEAGGLGKLSGDDIREALIGKSYGLGVSVGTNATSLTGHTNGTDLDVQMQVIAAFITDPGYRPDALARAKAALPAFYAASRTSPDGVYKLKATGAVYGDDPRFRTPTKEETLAVDNAHIVAVMKDQLAHGPIDVTIVGDITPDEAIRQVGATLGALPPRPAAVDVAGAATVRFPTNDLHRVYTHDGRADQNISVIAWPTIDYYADPHMAAALELLAAVMTMRELEEVRERQGATYSAGVNSSASRIFAGFGYLQSRASVKPEVDDLYYATVAKIADDLKSKPVSADELKRARLPLIDRLHNEKNANGYWTGLLSGTIRDPRQIASAQARERTLMSITATDIQQAAQTYLDMAKALRIQVKPRAEAK